MIWIYGITGSIFLIGAIHGLCTEGTVFQSPLHFIGFAFLFMSIIFVDCEAKGTLFRERPPPSTQGKGSGLLLAILCLSIFADSEKK